MAATRRLRLSPSGPFVADAVSGESLPVGDGSTGLIWRVQGPLPGVPPQAIPGGAVPELTTAWQLPAGFHYDLRAKFKISAAVPIDTVGVLNADIQIEEATAPGVWVTVANNTLAAPSGVDFPMNLWSGAIQIDCRIISCENVDLDRTGTTTAITGVRCTLNETMVAGAFLYLAQQCNLRVEQYVQ